MLSLSLSFILIMAQVKEVFSHKDNHSSHVTTMDKSHVTTQPVDSVDIPDFSRYVSFVYQHYSCLCVATYDL